MDENRAAELWSRIRSELGQKADQAQVGKHITWQCNPNLLSNWYFVNPVNQRGQLQYTTAGKYTIDMWRLHINGGDYDVTSHTMAFNNLTWSGLATTVEWSADYPVQTVTASILYSSEVDTVFTLYYEGIKQSTTLQVPAHAMELYSLTAIVPAGTTGIQVQLNHNTASKPSGSAVLTAAKLELGPVQTLAHKEGDTWALNDPPPNKALELAKCQRYQLFGPMSASYQHHYQAMDRVALSTPTTMRTTPTLVGTPEIRKLSDNTLISGAQISKIYSYNTNIIFSVTGTSEHCFIYFPPGTGLDCNL